MALLVMHTHLGRIAGEAVGKRGDEGVDRAAAHDGLDDRPLVRAQHATLVRHADVGRHRAHAVDEFRSVGAEKRVVPLQPESADIVVTGVDALQERRDVLRRVLQIGIERDDHVALHALKRRHDGHVLAVVGVEIDDAGDVGALRVLGAEQLDGAVVRAVVGEEDFVATPEAVEHRVQAREEGREIQLLVVNRDDDRELDRTGDVHALPFFWITATNASTTRATSSRVIVGNSGSVRMFRPAYSA